MNHSLTRLFSAILLLGIFSNWGNAQTTPPANVSDEQIRQLIVQLGDDAFAKRESATTQLQAIGKPAISQLQVAAKSHDPEVRVRATQILEAINGPAASTPTTTATGGVILQGNGNVIIQGNAQFVPGRNGGGGFMINMAPPAGVVIANAGAVQAMPVGVANFTTSEGEEFTHGGKKYQVTRTSINGATKITVSITETKDGKEINRTIEAVNDEELAKKDADLAKFIAKNERERFHTVVAAGNAVGNAVGAGNIAIAVAGNANLVAPVNGGVAATFLDKDALGLKLENITKGFRVVEIKDNSPAAKFGLRKDDIITSFTGDTAPLRDDSTITIQLLRDEKPVTLKGKFQN